MKDLCGQQIDRYREAAARRQDRQMEIEVVEKIAVEDDSGACMDAKWRVTCRMAAD